MDGTLAFLFAKLYTKLRWLSVVKRTFQLLRELAEVKMAAVTSWIVCIAIKRQDIIDRDMSGEFLSVSHFSGRTRETSYASQLRPLTRFPIDVNPSLAKEHPSVYILCPSFHT